MLRRPRGIHSFRLMTEANRRTLLRSSRRLTPRPRSSALLGRESHAASLGAFQPMSPISGSFAVRALSSSSHVEESIAQGSPPWGKSTTRNARSEERPGKGAGAITAGSNRPPRRTTEANIEGDSSTRKAAETGTCYHGLLSDCSGRSPFHVRCVLVRFCHRERERAC